MKTAELTGAALDWAVAKCEGLTCFGHQLTENKLTIVLSNGSYENFEPSCNWAQGGAIIERERIELVPDEIWNAYKQDQHIPNTGMTPLIAAMRCYVASKLGDQVEVPDELINHA
jgi:hypothetical protein